MRQEVLLKSEPGDQYAKEVIVGGEQRYKNKTVPNRKTVILLGRGRAGKTSLINAFANYLYNVTEEDEFRYTLLPVRRRSASLCSRKSARSPKCLKACRAYERTKQLTCYVFNNTVLSYPIAFVDTPPIDSDTGGSYSTDWSQYDTFEQIRRWFREGYYCPIEDLEVWLVIPSFDSHMRKIIWHTVNTVMREIECPVVRLVPIVSFAKNTEPSRALKSLAQVGYDGLIEGENFYSFNSSAILSATDGMVDKDALSFAENYAHMKLILNNLQKKFQWMTLHDGSAITTVMQVYLNREGGDKTRLYGTDSFRSGQYVAVGDHLKKAKLLNSRSFNQSNTINTIQSEDESNSSKCISNHETALRRGNSSFPSTRNCSSTNINDNGDLVSMSTEWTKCSINHLPYVNGLDVQPITNSTLKDDHPLNASIKPFVDQEVNRTTVSDGRRLSAIENEMLDEEMNEWDSANVSSAPTVTADLCKYYYDSVPSDTPELNENPRKLSPPSQSAAYIEEPDISADSGRDVNYIVSLKATPMASNVHLQQHSYSTTSHISSQISKSQQQRATVNEFDQNQESSTYDRSSTQSSSTVCDYSENDTADQKQIKCSRRETGREYEIIRIRRRKVKDESTQTTIAISPHSFIASQPEYLASDLEFQPTPTDTSSNGTNKRPNLESFTAENLVRGTLV